MSVQFENGVATFTDDAGALPPLRHPIVRSHEVRGEVVSAVWKADSVPTADGELVYHLYEGATHSTRAKYQYWSHAGYAGCLLNARHRMRLGIENDPIALVDEMFQALSA